MNKITYANKVDTRTTTDPEINKVTASTLNEIKTIVNETVDQVELNALPKTAAQTSLVNTNLSVSPATNLQSYAESNDSAVLRARGTGVSNTYINSVSVGGTTFNHGTVSGEINGDEGYFTIGYAGATNTTILNLTSPNTFVYINNAGALAQQTTEPTRQDWVRKMFTMRIAVDIVSQTILGFEYLNNPIGHYSNSQRDLYSFLLSAGVPFKKDQVVTGRANDLGFDVSAGSFLEFGGTGDIFNPNIPPVNAVSNATFFLSTRTAFDAGTNTNLPKFWDNNGTLTALGSTTLVAHRLYRFSNGNLCLQYGQGNYANMALAKVGARLEEYVLNPALKNATFFGWWFIESTATNTGGTTLTDFVEYTIGTQGGSSNSLSGCLLKGNNLSDLLDTATARTNLGVTSLDSQNVKLTGTQTIADEKEFTGLVKITDRLELSDALDNSFIGEDSGIDNTTGNFNVALGYQSLYRNTEGSNNIAIGKTSLRVNTTGSNNTALSIQSLFSNTTGNNNTSLGNQSLSSNTSADGNTALGTASLSKNTSGEYNLGLGYGAGQWTSNGTTPNQTGLNSIFIGKDTRANADGETNQIVIGDSAIGNGSNTVTLGHSTITDTYLIGHIRGNGAATFASIVNSGTHTIQETATNPNGLIITNRNSNQSFSIGVDASAVDDKFFAVFDRTNSFIPFKIAALSGQATFASSVTANKLNIIKNDNTVYDPTSDSGQVDSGGTIYLNNDSTTTDSFSQIVHDSRASGQAVARIVFLDKGASNSAIAFVTEGAEAKGQALILNPDKSAIFASSVTATRFIGVKNENFNSITATHTLLEGDYHVYNGQQFSTSTVTIPTGLSTQRSWEFSAEGFDLFFTAASGVTITVIANGAGSGSVLKIQGGFAAKLVSTSTANQFLLIK